MTDGLTDYGFTFGPSEVPRLAAMLDEIGGDECGDLLPGDEHLPLAANVDPVTEADREAALDRAERQR